MTVSDAKEENASDGTQGSTETATEADTSMITVLHGRKRLKLPVLGTVEALMTTLAEMTDVPAEEQMLLARGRKIDFSNRDKMATDVGLISGVTAMLRRKIPLKEGTTTLKNISRAKKGGPSNKLSIDDKRRSSLRPLREIDTTVADLNRELLTLETSVSRHTKGFLDAAKTREALQRDDAAARALDEQAMRKLEFLDTLEPPFALLDETNNATNHNDNHDDGDLTAEMKALFKAEWRSERKGVVGRLQNILVGVDRLRDRIRQLSLDEFDEVKHRRGKPE